MSEHSGSPGLGVPRLMAPRLSLSALTLSLRRAPNDLGLLASKIRSWHLSTRAAAHPAPQECLHSPSFLQCLAALHTCTGRSWNQLPRAPGLPGTHLLTTFLRGSKASCLRPSCPPKLPCSWLALGSLRNPLTYLHIEYLLQVSKELFPLVVTP